MADGKKGKQAKADDTKSISSTKGDFNFTDSDSSGFVATSNKTKDKKQKKQKKKKRQEKAS
ncbi:hypothetical protein ACMFMG_003508 [Clarireedia jacksonii]